METIMAILLAATAATVLGTITVSARKKAATARAGK